MSHQKHRADTNCLNCGAEVSGKFCSQCGQENLETHETVPHMVTHFVSDYLHFDSKFLRSLAPLFTRPGFLTSQYWDGKRVFYIHPLRLFFFVTILFMLATSYFYKHYGATMRSSIISGDAGLAKYDLTYLETLKQDKKLYLQGQKDSVTVGRMIEMKNREARQISKINSGFDFVFVNLKYVTFFLLPLYALIFRLLNLKQKKYYVDHLVYTVHLQTFVYFLFTFVLLLTYLFSWSLELMRQVTFICVLIYVFLSLQYLYHQHWAKTLLKSIIATIAIFVATSVIIAGLALVDAVYFQ